MLDEQQIAENLKQNIANTGYTAPAPATPTDTQPAFQSNISLGDPIVATQLNDYFELTRADRYSEERQHQLKTVLEWAANSAQSNEVLDILNVIQRKELEIGHKPFIDRLKTLYRLAKIEAQTRFIDQERQQIYGS